MFWSVTELKPLFHPLGFTRSQSAIIEVNPRNRRIKAYLRDPNLAPAGDFPAINLRWKENNDGKTESISPSHAWDLVAVYGSGAPLIWEVEQFSFFSNFVLCHVPLYYFIPPIPDKKGQILVAQYSKVRLYTDFDLLSSSMGLELRANCMEWFGLEETGP
ncbi:hypothetical protein BGX38DRAFT_425435 [Terfezia claveryi]|nr:hypothetical protein BGX38DRAFT_425435 [Terfezia claveryi]